VSRILSLVRINRLLKLYKVVSYGLQKHNYAALYQIFPQPLLLYSIENFSQKYKSIIRYVQCYKD